MDPDLFSFLYANHCDNCLTGITLWNPSNLPTYHGCKPGIRGRRNAPGVTVNGRAGAQTRSGCNASKRRQPCCRWDKSVAHKTECENSGKSGWTSSFVHFLTCQYSEGVLIVCAYRIAFPSVWVEEKTVKWKCTMRFKPPAASSFFSIKFHSESGVKVSRLHGTVVGGGPSAATGPGGAATAFLAWPPRRVKRGKFPNFR